VIRHLSGKASVTAETEHFKTNAIPSWDICAYFNRASNRIRTIPVSYVIMIKHTYLTSAIHQSKKPPIDFFLFYIFIFLFLIHFHAFTTYLLFFLEK